MKQMTKDEAKATIAGIMASRGISEKPYTDAAAFLESLQALGLWTPTDPKSVEDEAADALGPNAFWQDGESIIGYLKAAGFTVTKAVTP